MVKPASGAYRVLNCSAVYADELAIDAGTNALQLPCAVVQDGALPESATCDYDKERCLMALHCGYCDVAGRVWRRPLPAVRQCGVRGGGLDPLCRSSLAGQVRPVSSRRLKITGTV